MVMVRAKVMATPSGQKAMAMAMTMTMLVAMAMATWLWTCARNMHMKV